MHGMGREVQELEDEIMMLRDYAKVLLMMSMHAFRQGRDLQNPWRDAWYDTFRRLRKERTQINARIKGLEAVRGLLAH